MVTTGDPLINTDSRAKVPHSGQSAAFPADFSGRSQVASTERSSGIPRAGGRRVDDYVIGKNRYNICRYVCIYIYITIISNNHHIYILI